MSADYSSRRVRGHPNDKPAYEVTLRCRDCGHVYTRIIRAASSLELDAKPNPPCPKCRKVAAKRAPLNLSAPMPAIVGSAVVRAADMAAEMVMQDHGLTDLRGPTETRHGEPSRPKIAPALQTMADNMFGGGGGAPLIGGGQILGNPVKRRPLTIAGLNPNSEGFRRAVISGAFSQGGAAESGMAIQTKPRQRVQDVARIINEGKE
jgi:phage FluMu protein Com